eukprot:3615068-Lingulodinium_polyedra.AAC.1
MAPEATGGLAALPLGLNDCARARGPARTTAGVGRAETHPGTRPACRAGLCRRSRERPCP